MDNYKYVSWEEFSNNGMLWLTNRFLQLFGYGIGYFKETDTVKPIKTGFKLMEGSSEFDCKFMNAVINNLQDSVKEAALYDLPKQQDSYYIFSIDDPITGFMFVLVKDSKKDINQILNTLTIHYNTPERVFRLLSYGNIYELGNTIESTKFETNKLMRNYKKITHIEQIKNAVIENNPNLKYYDDVDNIPIIMYTKDPDTRYYWCVL